MCLKDFLYSGYVFVCGLGFLLRMFFRTNLYFFWLGVVFFAPVPWAYAKELMPGLERAIDEAGDL